MNNLPKAAPETVVAGSRTHDLVASPALYRCATESGKCRLVQLELTTYVLGCENGHDWWLDSCHNQ